MAIKVAPAGMPIQEQINMLDRCRDEISTLRGRIATLEPKAHAYDALCKVLGMMPDRATAGMGEDVLWVINRRRDKLAKEYAPALAAEQLGIGAEEAEDRG